MDAQMLPSAPAVQRPKKRFLVLSLFAVCAMIGAFCLGRVTAPQAGYLGGVAPLRRAPRSQQPLMMEQQQLFGRREALSSVAAAAVSLPLAANAYDYNAKAKAMATFGQTVLALQDASAEDIFANRNAIVTFASAMIRASGKRNVDARAIGKSGNPIGEAADKAVTAAALGDKGGANAALKDMIKLANVKKIAPYGSDANPVVGGNTFGAMSGSRGTPGTW